MTAKEQLEILVAELGEEEADRALGLVLESLPSDKQRELRGFLRALAADAPSRADVSSRRTRRSALVGAGSSGRTDVSERADELLAEGFGD